MLAVNARRKRLVAGLFFYPRGGSDDARKNEVVRMLVLAVARPLVEGLRIPTIAQDDRIWQLLGVERTTFDEAIRLALLPRG